MGKHPHPRLLSVWTLLVPFFVGPLGATCQSTTGGTDVLPPVTGGIELLRGSAAVDYLNSRPQAAATARGVLRNVEETLLRDSDLALVVDGPGGQEPALIYTCRKPSRPEDVGVNSAAAVAFGVNSAATAAVNSTAAAAITLPFITPPDVDDPIEANAFILHSRPGAPRIIYLNFVGATVTDDPLWNRPPFAASFTVPEYDTDGQTGFSSQERREIIAIWRAVSEDFLPFNVDVTTEAPADGVLDVVGVGVEAHVGGLSSDIGYNTQGIAGVAYLGVFGRPRTNRCFTFSEICPTAMCVWDVISHELGHTLELVHDGCKTPGNPACFGEYYLGQGQKIFTPIMGYGETGLTQWDRGEYADANNQEDDLAIIGGYIPKIGDDFGNAIASAHAITGSTTAAGASVTGAIESTADVDVFDVGQVSGIMSIEFSIIPDYSFPRSNLDARLRVLDRFGAIVAEWDNAVGLLKGRRDVVLPAGGQHFVSIEGVGQGNPLTDGWSAYGSLGSYSLNVRAQAYTPIECQEGVVVLQLPQAGTCVDAATLPPEAVADAAGVGYTLSPPGPYKPGRTSILVTPKDGGEACTVILDVLPCPPIVCKQDVQKQLAYGSCDGATFASTELWTGGPVGTVVVSTLTPPGPFAPAARSTKVTVTPTSPIGLAPCDALVAVAPCKPLCATTGPSVAVAPGTCTSPTWPAGLLDPASVSSLVDVSAMTADPPPPYRLGPRLSTAITIDYGDGLTVTSPACEFAVKDLQKPVVADKTVCIQPKNGNSFAATSHCFASLQLASGTDNCKTVRYTIGSCRNLRPLLPLGKPNPCFFGPALACVNIANAPAPSDTSTPRTLQVTLTASDSSNNKVALISYIDIYYQPKEGCVMV